ncbi:MAG: Gfo/Idh/MocA family oxidoreductase [Actinobacteria bacterium]|nr:Gfo/Idh/MocA family oxidoreductase [Actinomycetota bacterium]
MNTNTKMDVTIVGGGMITEMQILPSVYQLQRMGTVNDISICALNAPPLEKIVKNETLHRAFPGQTFKPYPDFHQVSAKENFPDLYQEVVSSMKPRNIVMIALPDQMHYNSVLYALEHDQHILSVKPLTLNYNQAHEIERLAFERGLFVGVEYHKRFDDRVGMARMKYRAGDFGEFRVGMATLIEPWYYRDSNFQNWCTTENSDMFTYIGCHYVDQVHMITGLLPARVSVYGSVETYPNGNKGYLWTTGRVIWENGACLTVINGMGYPNVGPGGNSQGIWLFTQGEKDGGLLFHDDQYRGIKHSYIRKGNDPGESFYNEPSPDYFKLIERGGDGLTPVGYGYRSIEAIVNAIGRVENYGGDDLEKRQEMIKTIDGEGIIATPANSSFNELVIEAGRMSILNDGRDVVIEYGENPHVHF